jgi:hypothetical protein
VAQQNIDYRVRVAHTSHAGQPPNLRFDLWERVNNNDGTWQPQIIYAVNDRVLYQGSLYAARSVHQAKRDEPPATTPELWHPLPMTACGQLAEFCAEEGGSCLATGQAGVETTCSSALGACLPVCTHAHGHPCSGLCNDAIQFTVPDGTTFQSGPLGPTAACYETTSELASGSSSGFLGNGVGGGRCSGDGDHCRLTVNGREMPLDGDWTPLPPQRNHGYCIQTNRGNFASASFSVR